MTDQSATSAIASWPHVERRARGREALAWNRKSETVSRLALLGADILALAFMFVICLLLRDLLFDNLPAIHWSTWYSMGSWLLFRAGSGLYSPCSLFPPDELKRSFETSAMSFVLHLALLITMGAVEPVRFVMLLIWFCVLPLTYMMRTIARTALIKRKLYGVPLVILGNGDAARRAIREYQSRPESGFIPVALFSSEMTAAGERQGILGVPLVGRVHQATTHPFPYPIRHALLAMGNGWSDDQNHSMTRTLAKRFNSLQVFTNFITDSHLLSRMRSLGPYLTVETQHVRFSESQRLLKRALDLSISVPALIVSAPVILVAAIAIKIVDPGPVFFGQIREGRDGKPVRIYKLRSMVVGAEDKLAQYLAENPAARFEYEQTMKLRKDPRVLPGLGAFIRKTSIDELPQLWNIVKGDMSLVGPRVMPTREIDLYSESGRELRRDMVPGLTGFWQVEHRNDSDFQVRELADSFYVSNWTVWLDLWIILRTVRVLFSRSGAY